MEKQKEECKNQLQNKEYSKQLYFYKLQLKNLIEFINLELEEIPLEKKQSREKYLDLKNIFIQKLEDANN